MYTIIILLIITPIGFYSKFYSGPAECWINDSLGGLLYEIFWCLILFFLLPKTRSIIIAGGVLIITCVLEILQLWHPPILQTIRKTFIGKTLIGTSFVWSDFFYYFIGCCIGFFIIQFLKKKNTNISTHHDIVL